MIRPFDHRVLIERESAAETFKGIIIPSRYRRAPLEGIVKAIGSKVTTVRPGDRVLFGRHSGIETDTPGQIFLWERDLMALLEPGEPGHGMDGSGVSG